MKKYANFTVDIVFVLAMIFSTGIHIHTLCAEYLLFPIIMIAANIIIFIALRGWKIRLGEFDVKQK